MLITLKINTELQNTLYITIGRANILELYFYNLDDYDNNTCSHDGTIYFFIVLYFQLLRKMFN